MKSHINLLKPIEKNQNTEIAHLNCFCWLMASLRSSQIANKEVSPTTLSDIKTYLDLFLEPLIPSECNPRSMAAMRQVDFTWLIVLLDGIACLPMGTTEDSPSQSTSAATKLLLSYKKIVRHNMERVIMGLLQNLNIRNIDTKVLSATVCCLCYIIHHSPEDSASAACIKQILVPSNISQLIRLCLSKAVYPTLGCPTAPAQTQTQAGPGEISKRPRSDRGGPREQAVRALSSDWEVVYSLLGLTKLLQHPLVMSGSPGASSPLFEVATQLCTADFARKWTKRLRDAADSLYKKHGVTSAAELRIRPVFACAGDTVGVGYAHKVRNAFAVLAAMAEATRGPGQGSKAFRQRLFVELVGTSEGGPAAWAALDFMHLFLHGYDQSSSSLVEGAVTGSALILVELSADALVSNGACRLSRHLLLNVLDSSPIPSHSGELPLLSWYCALVPVLVNCWARGRRLADLAGASALVGESVLNEALPLFYALLRYYHSSITAKATGCKDVHGKDVARCLRSGVETAIGTMSGLCEDYIRIARSDGSSGTSRHILSMLVHILLILNDLAGCGAACQLEVQTVFGPWGETAESRSSLLRADEDEGHVGDISSITMAASQPGFGDDADDGYPDASYIHSVQMYNTDCILTYDGADPSAAGAEPEGLLLRALVAEPMFKLLKDNRSLLLDALSSAATEPASYSADASEQLMRDTYGSFGGINIVAPLLDQLLALHDPEPVESTAVPEEEGAINGGVFSQVKKEPESVPSQSASESVATSLVPVEAADVPSASVSTAPSCAGSPCGTTVLSVEFEYMDQEVDPTIGGAVPASSQSGGPTPVDNQQSSCLRSPEPRTADTTCLGDDQSASINSTLSDLICRGTQMTGLGTTQSPVVVETVPDSGKSNNESVSPSTAPECRAVTDVSFVSGSDRGEVGTDSSGYKNEIRRLHALVGDHTAANLRLRQELQSRDMAARAQEEQASSLLCENGELQQRLVAQEGRQQELESRNREQVRRVQSLEGMLQESYQKLQALARAESVQSTSEIPRLCARIQQLEGELADGRKAAVQAAATQARLASSLEQHAAELLVLNEQQVLAEAEMAGFLSQARLARLEVAELRKECDTLVVQKRQLQAVADALVADKVRLGQELSASHEREQVLAADAETVREQLDDALEEVRGQTTLREQVAEELVIVRGQLDEAVVERDEGLASLSAQAELQAGLEHTLADTREELAGVQAEHDAAMADLCKNKELIALINKISDGSARERARKSLGGRTDPGTDKENLVL